MFNEGHNAALMTSLERAQQERIAELEARLAEMEKMYDKVAADLIEALDVASAYRATASTMHQEIERRNGVERRQNYGLGAMCPPPYVPNPKRIAAEDRRKSWPR
jgi:cell division septum initiation protein DivIVA